MKDDQEKLLNKSGNDLLKVNQTLPDKSSNRMKCASVNPLTIGDFHKKYRSLQTTDFLEPNIMSF